MPALAFTPIVLTPFAFPPLVLPPLALAPLALAPFVFTPLLLAPLRFLPGALLFPRAAEPIARRDVDRRRGRVHDHRLCWLDIDRRRLDGNADREVHVGLRVGRLHSPERAERHRGDGQL